MHVACAQITLFARGHHRVDPAQHFVVVGQRERDPEDVYGHRRSHRSALRMKRLFWFWAHKQVIGLRTRKRSRPQKRTFHASRQAKLNMETLKSHLSYAIGRKLAANCSPPLSAALFSALTGMSSRLASIAPFSRASDGPQPYQGRPCGRARVAPTRYGPSPALELCQPVLGDPSNNLASRGESGGVRGRYRELRRGDLGLGRGGRD